MNRLRAWMLILLTVLCPSLEAQIPDDVSTRFVLHSASPFRHSDAGGSLLVVQGDQFSDRTRLRLGGVDLRPIRRFGPGTLTTRIPPLPPGIHDLEAIDGATGRVDDTLPAAVEILPAAWPPVAGVSTQLDGRDVLLRWGHVFATDEVEIRRAGLPVANLPGDATEWIDVGAFTGSALDYEIVTRRGAVGGAPASFRVAALDEELRSHVSSGLGRASSQRLALRGMHVDQYSAVYRWTRSSDPIFTVHATRWLPGSQLVCDVHDLEGGHLVASGLPFEDLPVSARGRRVSTTLPVSLARDRSYELRISVAGGSPEEVQFSLAADLAQQAVVELADQAATPWCASAPRFQAGPSVQNVAREPLPAFGPSDLLASSSTTLIGSGSPGDTLLAQIGAHPVVLRAEVLAPSAPILRYEWSFGDGTFAETATDLVTHAYPEFGSYDLRLQVVDENLNRAAGTFAIHILPEEQPGSEPRISSLSPHPDEVAWIPDIEASTPQAFQVHALASKDGGPVSVSMDLVDVRSGGVLQSQNAFLRAGTWEYGIHEACFDMSQLPPHHQVRLRVRADDGTGVTERTETYELCRLPRFEHWNHLSLDVRPRLRDGKFAGGYDLDYEFDPGPLVDLPIRLLGKDFSNRLVALASAGLQLRGRDWTATSLVGEFSALFMNRTLFSERHDIAARTQFLDCPDFGLAYDAPQFTLFERGTEVTVFDRVKLGEPCWYAGAVCVAFYASLKYEFFTRLLLDLVVALSLDDPKFELDATITPQVELDAEAELEAEVSIFEIPLLSLLVTLYPNLQLALPVDVYFATPRTLQLSTDGVCFELDLDYKLELDLPVPFKDLSTGRQDLVDEEWGNCGPQPPRGADDPIRPNGTALAVSVNEDRAMVVTLVENDQGEYKFVHRLRENGQWSAPADVLPFDEHQLSDADLVYVGTREALLVYVRNEISTTDAAALPATAAGLNLYLSQREVYAVRWTGSAWEAPQRITDNAVAEGFPEAARIDVNGEAMVAWTRNEGGAVFPSGSARTSVWSRLVRDAIPLEPEVLLAGADGLDHFGVQLGSRGFDAHAVWITEDPGTGRRSLSYSNRYGPNWSAPHSSYGEPEFPRIAHLDLSDDLSSSGMVCFTTLPDPGVPNEVELGAAQRCGHFLPFDDLDPQFGPGPMPLLHQGREVPLVGPRAFERDGRTHVVARSFMDDEGALDRHGEVGVFVLAPDRREVATFRCLTSDPRTNYEVRGAAIDDDLLLSVRTSSDSLAADGLEILEQPLVENLALGDVRLSDPHASNLVPQDVHFRVRNDELNRVQMSWRVELISDRHGILDTIQGSGSFEPGESLARWLRLPPGHAGDDLRLVLIEDASDDPSDNERSLRHGVLPPTNVEVELPRGSAHAHLQWTNSEDYDEVLVWRDGQVVARLPGSSTAMVDRGFGPGLRRWAVVGVIGPGRSDLRDTEVDATVYPVPRSHR